MVLFPEHEKRRHTEFQLNEEVSSFSVNELNEAEPILGNKKAPSPDGIPNEVIKVILNECPYILLNIFNACLRAGVFSPR